MSLQRAITTFVGGFLLTTSSRIAAVFFSKKLDANSSKGKQSHLPSKVQPIKDDPRLVKAQIEYLHRKNVRDNELLAIQADLVNMQEIRFRADMQIAQAQAEREERALQLKEEELKDRRAISKLQRQLMRELQANEIQIKLKEIQTIWDRCGNWSSTLSREETEKILLDGREQQRLLMLVSPPDISEDCPVSFRNNLATDIRNGLKAFMGQYYPLDSELSPVEFYGKYFNRSIFDVEVKQLETLLAPVPTAILYSDISDYEVHFHIGFWGLENQTVSLIPIQPWNWERVKEELEAAGKDEKQSLRIVRQLIVLIHKLLAAFLADLYYLNIDVNYEPQLFNLDSEFVQEWFSQEWFKSYIDLLKDIQRQQRETYERELQRLAIQAAKELAERKVTETAEHLSQVQPKIPAQTEAENEVAEPTIEPQEQTGAITPRRPKRIPFYNPNDQLW